MPQTPKKTPEEVVAEKLTTARHGLTHSANSTYLGITSSLNNLIWIRDGNADRLVTKADAEATETAFTSFTADPDNADEPSPAPSALLSMAGIITSADYWLTSCGMWRGVTQAAPNFADVKPTCTVAAADHPVFRDDFPKVIANINTLLNACNTANFTPTGVIVNGGLKVKIRHTLFTAIDDSSSESSTAASDDLPVEFTIAGWPAYHDEARDALQTMQDTHRVNYLPAYDMHGNLIPPGSYRSYLEGAVAQVHFRLTHWAIGSKKTDVYAADIESIRVLIPPKPKGPVTPKKRKFFKRDPFTPDLSPKKAKPTA